MLYYFDYCVYWYTYEEQGNFSVDTLGKRFHMEFLGYEHWFMSIRISQLKDHYYSSVDQKIYAPSIVTKYLDTVTIKLGSKFHENTFPHDMIFTKEDASTSDKKVEVLYRECYIYYRA